MKYQFIILIFLGLVYTAKAQEGIPEWFINEIRVQEGTWIADNAEYKEDGVDKYAIEWKLSPLRNSLYGRLYGINDSLEIGTFWSFHKYYDPSKKEVILMQIGYNGTLGIGSIDYKTNNQVVLSQTFTNPKGESHLEGHKMIYPDENTEIGSSYSISESGTWILKRAYIWKKTL